MTDNPTDTRTYEQVLETLRTDPDATEHGRRMADEVHYWREYAALRITLSQRAYENAVLEVDRSIAEQGLQDATVTLRNALDGDLHPTCSITGKVLRPGTPVVFDQEEGETYAGDGMSVGDHVHLEPDEIPEPESPDDPPHPGYAEVFGASGLFTTAEILQKLELGERALEAGRAEAGYTGAHPTPEACDAVVEPG